MNRLCPGLLAAIVMTSALAGVPSLANAGENSIAYTVEKVQTGFRCECRYVVKRVGLFGCRTRCVPQWVKVPVYGYVAKTIGVVNPGRGDIQHPNGPGPNEIGGVDMRGESGAEVTTGQSNNE